MRLDTQALYLAILDHAAEMYQFKLTIASTSDVWVRVFNVGLVNDKKPKRTECVFDEYLLCQEYLSIHVLGAGLVQVLMLELIREHESLFAKVPPPISARPLGGPHASPSALRQPHLHPSPCLRQLSMPLIVERSREAGQPAEDEQNPRYSRPALTKLLHR